MGNFTKAEIADIVDDNEKLNRALIDSQHPELVAELAWRYYVQFLYKGFTKEQAIELLPHLFVRAK